MIRCLILVGFVFFTSAAAQEPRVIDWPDLLPADEAERIQKEREEAALRPLLGHGLPGSEADSNEVRGVQAQGGTFSVVDELDGQFVSLAGFVVPLDYSGRDRLTGFLLVPYFGACIHFPPPPPNQIVYVTSEEPVPLTKLSQAYRITGTISTDHNYNELGNAAYTMTLDNWSVEN